MAGHVRYTALLDACVLYPILIADALMSLTVAGLFAAKWSRRVEEEWMRNLGRPARSWLASWAGDAMPCGMQYRTGR